MTIRRTTWVFMFCLARGVSFGETPVSEIPLSWDECVTIALRHNPDIASTRVGKEAKVSTYRGSFNRLLPGINLSNSYTDSQDATNALWSAQIAADMVLWDASQIAAIRSASALVDQADARQTLTSAQLRYDLRAAFLRRIFDDKDIDVSRNIQTIRQKSADLVTLRYESGRESKGNKLRTEAQYLQATADLAQARRRARSDQRSLYRQMGLPTVDDRPLVGSLDTRDPPGFPAVEELVDQRPDVRLQYTGIAIAQTEVARSRSALWPTLSADYSHFRTGAHEFPSDNSGWVVRGVLNYPLFAGGPTATAFAITASKQNLEQATLDWRSVREQAMAQMETAWSAYAGAMDQARVQTALLAAARQRNDEANVRYTSGLLTYDNWEIIVTDRVNQEQKAILAQLNAAVTQAAWELALGVPLE